MALRRHTLSEQAIPRRWYNVAADLPSLPPPPLHPGTGQPVGPEDLAPLFPVALILQEVSGERWIPIPDPVREVYSCAYNQRECFAEALRFARAEGVIPAPEPSHALRAVAEEVERAREEGVERTIPFNLCGHGNFDMGAYDAFLAGEMTDYALAQAELDEAAAQLEGLPAIAP